MPGPHAAYLARADERYREAHAAVGAVVRRTFPKAKPVFEYGMPSWRVARPRGVPRPEREGTMPSDRVFVGLARRAGGITLHLWYPGDDRLFDAHRRELRGAGFKVMRGCLAFNRTRAFPSAAVARLLAEIKRRDAALAKAPRAPAGARRVRSTGHR